ncbi:MAG: 2-amino-3,7-dideoxy-D-threo-hept-6-ulosonate synthase [Desulfohalobiaceae bacterium]
MHLGKAIRMERVINRDTERTIVVPMDHGVTVGPIRGLEHMKERVNEVAEGGGDAVLMHKGLVRCGHRERGRDIGLIIHLSASTKHSPSTNTKTLVGSVEDGIKLGADAVSVHVNLGDEQEQQMLGDLGRVASSATEWGIPVLAMVYARGPQVKDAYDPEVVAHCARVGEELGADLVKVNYTGDMDTFGKVAEGCCIPVVIAGGPKMDSRRELVQMVHDSVQAGGAGLSVGRNIFQDEDPAGLLGALHRVVHEDATVEDALGLLN